MKKIYIITGANGFLGNNIIRKLEQNSENEIRALVLPNDSIKALDNLNCKIYYGDITKKESLSSVFENIDGKEVVMQVKVGDKVIYSKYAGTDVELDGEEYIIVKQNDILAIVE